MSEEQENLSNLIPLIQRIFLVIFLPKRNYFHDNKDVLSQNIGENLERKKHFWTGLTRARDFSVFAGRYAQLIFESSGEMTLVGKAGCQSYFR